MECCCTVEIDIDHDSTPISHDIWIAIALMQEKCYECGRVIHIGEAYCREYNEWVDGWYDECDGPPDNTEESLIHTCDDCYSLRQVFFSSGWYYSMLWESMREFISECAGELSVPCILQLTKAARDKVLDMVEEEWGEVEICPKCEHLVETRWSGTKCSNNDCDYFGCL